MEPPGCHVSTQINSPDLCLINGCDQIAISGFSMSSDLEISNSRSSILRWSLQVATCPYKWTIQIPAWLTVVIKSRNRISQFRGFLCSCSLHYEIPIPDSPMAYLPRNFCRSEGSRPFGKFGWDPMVTGSLSSFFSVNSCCARFLQCCSSLAFTSESPRGFILHILPFLLLPSKTTIINTHSLLVQYFPTKVAHKAWHWNHWQGKVRENVVTSTWKLSLQSQLLNWKIFQYG